MELTIVEFLVLHGRVFNCGREAVRLQETPKS